MPGDPPESINHGSSSRAPVTSKWSALRPYCSAFILIIFTALYLYLGRHLINQTNGDRNRSDQQNNISLALKAKEFASPDFSAGLSR